jgi:hypothetical protein
VATTTNYGWSTPDNTGYVKDGALAIRTLGSAIDTSLVDLKGGTTDQVLKKASGTDMDFVWGTVSSTPRIAQVIQTSVTSAYSTTSGTYADATGWSATITPTLNTSKILVSYNFHSIGTYNETAGSYLKARINRSGTTFSERFYLTYNTSGSTSTAIYVPFSAQYLDAPATTSAVTYKLQTAAASTGGTVEFGELILMEVLV